VLAWIAHEFRSFLVGGPSSLARSGGTILDMRCMIFQPFAAGGNRSYLDFWAITGNPRYLGYKTPTIP
jgi:hypothetical protein